MTKGREVVWIIWLATSAFWITTTRMVTCIPVGLSGFPIPGPNSVQDKSTLAPRELQNFFWLLDWSLHYSPIRRVVDHLLGHSIYGIKLAILRNGWDWANSSIYGIAYTTWMVANESPGRQCLRVMMQNVSRMNWKSNGRLTCSTSKPFFMYAFSRIIFAAIVFICISW